MIYLDTILLSVISRPDFDQIVIDKDAVVLRSLGNVLSSYTYITEKQSQLAIRILQQYKDVFDIDDSILLSPVWMYKFRVPEQSRKLYIKDDQLIMIEFTYSSQIKKELYKLSSKLDQLLQIDAHKLYSVSLTESNIELLVEHLSPLGFNISDQLQDFYSTIKSWDGTDSINQYKLDTITHGNFQKQIAIDLGIDTPLNSNLIADRSKRYQYYINDKPLDDSLTTQIAFRSETKIWVNSNNYTLTDVFKSLVELKRLPVLVVFSSNDSKKSLKELVELSDAVRVCNIDDAVGIYFRMSNSEDLGKKFNQLISDNNYNNRLSNLTSVVGIQSTKIPKFIIKNDWKPMSVVSINTVLSNSKTAVYTNCCDLIVNYSAQEPLIMRKSWELN